LNIFFPMPRGAAQGGEEMDEAITLQLTIPGGASRIERARNVLAAEEIIMAAREKLSTLGVSLVEVVEASAAVKHSARSAAMKASWAKRSPEQRAEYAARMSERSKLTWARRNQANGHA
jgi:hypothetical protein